MADNEHVSRHLLDLDKICFEKCVSNPERSFSIKDENCLSIGNIQIEFIENCTTKVLNAIDFLHSVNKRGGIDRAPVKL